MTQNWKPGVLYLRVTPDGGKPYVTALQCWNTDLCYSAQIVQWSAIDENTKRPLGRVVSISKDAYDKTRFQKVTQ